MLLLVSVCPDEKLVSYVFVFIVMDVMPLWTDEGGLLLQLYLM